MSRHSMFRLLLITASVFTVNLANPSSAQQGFADGLTYHLDTKKSCQVSPIWRDDGSGANLDGYFFYAAAKGGYSVIGGYGTQDDKSGRHCVTIVREAGDNPVGTPPLLVAPKAWRLVWTDRGTGADKDGSMWHGVPPSNDYVCIGSVPQYGYNRPNIPNYRCVHNTLVEEITTGTLLWSDRGSNGREQVSIFKLPATGSFVAVKGRRHSLRTFDLKRAPSSRRPSAAAGTGVVAAGAGASQGWRNPDHGAKQQNVSPRHFQELEALVKEAERYKAADPRLLRDLRGLEKQKNWTNKLYRLVDTAERNRTADPRFLRDLRDLAKKYSRKKQGIIWDN